MPRGPLASCKREAGDEIVDAAGLVLGGKQDSSSVKPSLSNLLD
jgi:hypothetical protein